MSTSDKLNYLLETKNEIKSALINKGVEVADTDTFRSCAKKIDNNLGLLISSSNELFSNFSTMTNAQLNNFSFIDYRHCGNTKSMFYNCESLTKIEAKNLKNLKPKYAIEMFSGCKNLTDLCEFDGSLIYNVRDMFYNCINLTNFGGMKDIGKKLDGSNRNVNLGNSVLLTHDSLMNVINKLYDITTIPNSLCYLTLNSTNLAKLTEEEIAIATAKGWTVS